MVLSIHRNAVVVTALALTVLLASSCGQRKIQNVEHESEANRIIDVLGEAGIRASKREAGEGERKFFEILIDGNEDVAASAIQVMRDHCLAESPPEMPEGSSVITTTQVEKEREARRRKLNIESQLRDIPGVTCVRVNFVMPEDSSIAIDRYPSTATALVTYKTATFPLSRERVAEMIAKGVPALKAENVSVDLLQKNVRPLPDYRAGYNVAQIAIISLIGFLTVLATVSLVFILQKRRQQVLKDGPIEEFGPIDQDAGMGDTSLLHGDRTDDRVSMN